MNQQMMLANPNDWCTAAYAAEKIGVSLRTVYRLIKEGRLRAYVPRKGSRETGRRHTLLALEEVTTFATAHKLVNGGGDA